MYIDWKIFIKPYMPTEDYIPDDLNSKKFSGLLLFVVLGFVTSFCLISRVDGKTENYTANNPVHLKIQKIKADIELIESQNAVLESEMLLLNHSVTQLHESREQNEIVRLSRLTGSHKAIGSGVIITLSDNNKPLGQDENPNMGLVHNTDILNMVNDLWIGNAQAVSINGERVTEKTSIRCVGPTIMINKTRIAPPFIIKAVGNPEKLIKFVQEGHLENLASSGINYSTEKYEHLEIPADDTIILAGEN